MSFRFSLRSMDRMRRVDPRLVAVAVIALSRSPVDFGVTEEQSRTVEEQRQKVRDGYSKTMNTKHMIPAGGSFSTGLDLVPWVDGRSQWGDDHWRIKRNDGSTVDAFFEMAAVMRQAAIDAGVRVRWGAVWDRVLNDLPAGAAALRAEVEAYKVRHVGSDFLDGPHYELVD
jgi:peptidoglycan L-alanyl-D-glutamate endopeptidase CwlK